jgi:hypothetical protein
MMPAGPVPAGIFVSGQNGSGNRGLPAIRGPRVKAICGKNGSFPPFSADVTEMRCQRKYFKKKSHWPLIAPPNGF